MTTITAECWSPRLTRSERALRRLATALDAFAIGHAQRRETRAHLRAAGVWADVEARRSAAEAHAVMGMLPR